jgi:predicted SprT family Zn-dependent metalloprotease
MNEQTQQQEYKSIKPSIAESERFISFLNNKFNLGLQNDLIILIHETSPNIKGFFRPQENIKSFELVEEKKPINSITLSSHTLTSTPYETLAHELAHYINHAQGIKDCSGNQYHNKHFKLMAEKLLLKVDKDRVRGFAYTEETQEFKAMLQEFSPSPDAFKIFQNIGISKEKKKSRLLLFECGCGCKIRTAKNENKPLKAFCQYCSSEFLEVAQ